jgi:enoyl-CoA hydratase/carnithine racemase
MPLNCAFELNSCLKLWASSDRIRSVTVINPITLPLSTYATRHVRLAVENRIATVTLNRPEKKNPLTFESYAELSNLFRAAAQDDHLGAIVITGEGGNFCSGGDVFEIIAPLLKMNVAERLRFTRMTGDLVKAMRSCAQPVIAAIDGICAGAGAIIAMASDIRIGTPEAKVAFLFNRVGLAGCDMGACAILPRIVGQGRAAELLLTGRTMRAEEAEKWGFLNRLCAVDRLMAEALTLAQALAEGPAFANSMTKRMLEMEWAMSVEAAVEAEAVAQALCMDTQDFARAFHAFAEKRKPQFEGN